MNFSSLIEKYVIREILTTLKVTNAKKCKIISMWY